MTRILRGEGDATELRIGVVRARFNETITEALQQGALARLAQIGVSEVTLVEVPGAVEIPLAAQRLAHLGLDAVIALGAVIRGESSHYDYVCKMVADGCLRVGLEENLPVAFGVLTTEDEDQALARCRPDESNKGFEAASVAVEMALLMRASRS